MKYTTLFFDLDGTILDFSKSETAALTGAYSIVFGTDPSDDILPVYQKINSDLWKEFEKGTIKIHELKIKRFSDLFDNLELRTDPVAFSDIYLEELGKGGYLLDGALDVLESCAGRFRIGAITNGIGNVQRSRIKKAQIGQFFETVVISNDVGIAKPDPGIFTIALENMDLYNKEEILMIGDSLSSDILGGINAGIDTCWINSLNIESGDIQPGYTISKISLLMEILV